MTATTARARAARAALIDAAEEVAVERGLAAMALSTVQERAGQANKSAATYHFGSRAGLVAAVLERRMTPVNRRRWELLEQWDERSSRGAGARVATALVRPLAAETVQRPGSRYARFLMQAMLDPVQATTVSEHLEADSFRELRRRYLAATPLDGPAADLRFGSAVTLCVSTLATWEGHGDTDPATLAVVVEDLVHLCAVLLDAPRAADPT